MNGPNDTPLRRGLRAWWQSPPRSGLQRLINPGSTATSAPLGSCVLPAAVAAGASVIRLSYAVYGWAAFFGAIAALNLAGGSWYITIDRSAAA